MKKLNLLFAGAFAALAIVACSDDELETETNTGTDTETEEGGTGDENTGEEEEAPQAYITLNEAELQFARTGGEATVTVDANYDWVCAYESDWFTVVADTNAGTLTVTCDANETGEVRGGAVTVTASDGEENVAEATLKITQSIYEAAALVLEYTITSDNTTIQLPLGEKDYDGNKYDIDCTVDWGDGSEIGTVTGKYPSHTYSAGTYNVIINGRVEHLCGHNYEQYKTIDGMGSLTAVKQWGDTELKSMEWAFESCTNLASLPDGPGSFSNVTSFNDAFDGCASLTAVPEDMFSGCTAAENFDWVFKSCSSLTSAPSFKGLSNVTSFYCAFWDCESLTTVPEDMFSGCTAVENFGYPFWDCISLTTVPDNLFADCPSVESFYAVFGECASLETVPVGIFDNNESVTNFSWAFYDCPKLVGESPYTEIEGNKVHLYERESYPDYFTALTYYSDCFTGCTGLDDYYSIPSGWGGGASPSSVTPQSLNATSPEGFGPSRLGPQRDAATPQGSAARLQRDAATPQGSAARLQRDAATPQGPAARPLPTRK